MNIQKDNFTIVEKYKNNAALLRRWLEKYFETSDDLRKLCQELNIHYEGLSGESTYKTYSLANYLIKREKLPQLIESLQNYDPELVITLSDFAKENSTTSREKPKLSNIVEDNTDTKEIRQKKDCSIQITKSEENLKYVIEEQSWYVPNFPEVQVVSSAHCDSLKQEIDVILITATLTELKAVMCLLHPYPNYEKILKMRYEHETYYLGKFGEYNTVVMKCGMGTIGEDSVGFATTDAQRLWNPRAIIMVGIAFGKDPKTQNIADVLVASDIIRYDELQRVGATEINYRGSIPPSHTTLFNRFINAFDWKFQRPDGSYCQLISGPILSGQKLVDNIDFKTQLFEKFPHAVGGEMEGDGLSASAGRLSTPWILVKSICDWADGNKDKQHQPLAAAAAASLVHHVLSEPYVIDSLKKPGGN